MDDRENGEHFLSNILLNGENGCIAGLDDMDFPFTQNTQAVEEVEDEVQASRVTKGTKRSKNFHWREDEVICSAWLNVSKDPIHGANQTKTTFYGRIKAYFDKHKTTKADRSESFVMHRWLFIQCSVNKFCSAYDAILRRNQSGLTMEDKKNEAKKLYIEWDKEKKTFVLEHCWLISKEEDKWKAKMIELAEIDKEKQGSKKKHKVVRPTDEETTNNDQVVQLDDEETPPRKRLYGIKKAKENLRRGGGEACVEALDKLMAEKKVVDMEKEKAKEESFMAALEIDKAALEIDKEKVELEKKRVQNEEKKAEAKLLKEENKIMLTDMSKLTPVQREWLEKKQKMIVEKM